MLACFLGVFKAGHPYIPVDDQSSPQRLVDISQRSGAEFCLALANLPVDLEDINLVKDEKLKKFLLLHIKMQIKEYLHKKLISFTRIILFIN
jgi:Non-ribosomal peptide synthetase modules and related proteins